MGFVGIGEGKSILLNVANIPHDPLEQVNIPIEESDISLISTKLADLYEGSSFSRRFWLAY